MYSHTSLLSILLAIYYTSYMNNVLGYSVRPGAAIAREELLGVWRLTSKLSLLRKALLIQEDNTDGFGDEQSDFYDTPYEAAISNKKFGKYDSMKDFTVQKCRSSDGSKRNKNASVLIRLRENGSFSILENSKFYEVSLGIDKFNSDSVEDDSLRIGGIKNKSENGQWHLENGKIILAPFIPKVDAGSKALTKIQRENDMLLCGKVLCCTDGVMSSTSSTPKSIDDKDSDKVDADDKVIVPMQFSVPFGSVETGKFTYPPNHMSFFDGHPMFKPKDVGHFQMQKVISEAPENVDVEKYCMDDLAGRRFFITAEPLKKKKKERWSRSLGKMVEVVDDENDDSIDAFVSSMQVIEVELFKNHKFTTVAGLGSSVTLRGRWDIIGQDKDQIWLQVWRFGFGRSVSGSTFSEGANLTQNDDKGYWGVIREYSIEDGEKLDSAVGKNTRLEIRGMVLLGYGLEPTTIGRFTMVENTSVNNEEDDDGDEDTDSYFDSLGEFQ